MNEHLVVKDFLSEEGTAVINPSRTSLVPTSVASRVALISHGSPLDALSPSYTDPPLPTYPRSTLSSNDLSPYLKW